MVLTALGDLYRSVESFVVYRRKVLHALCAGASLLVTSCGSLDERIDRPLPITAEKRVQSSLDDEQQTEEQQSQVKPLQEQLSQEHKSHQQQSQEQQYREQIRRQNSLTEDSRTDSTVSKNLWFEQNLSRQDQEQNLELRLNRCFELVDANFSVVRHSFDELSSQMQAIHYARKAQELAAMGVADIDTALLTVRYGLRKQNVLASAFERTGKPVAYVVLPKNDHNNAFRSYTVIAFLQELQESYDLFVHFAGKDTDLLQHSAIVSEAQFLFIAGHGDADSKSIQFGPLPSPPIDPPSPSTLLEWIGYAAELNAARFDAEDLQNLRFRSVFTQLDGQSDQRQIVLFSCNGAAGGPEANNLLTTVSSIARGATVIGAGDVFEPALTTYTITKEPPWVSLRLRTSGRDVTVGRYQDDAMTVCYPVVLPK